MARAGRRSNRKAWQAFAEQYKANAVSFTLAILVIVVLFAAVGVLSAAKHGWHWFDFFIGGCVGGFLMFLAAAIFITAGAAPAWMGSTVEERTADELLLLDDNKRRPRWRFVHGVVVHESDVDHVAIGPAGVFAVETKWRSDDWTGKKGREYLGAACDQAWRGARNISLVLRADGVVLPVTPVLVLWRGAAAVLLEELVRVEAGDVTVVKGTAIEEWRVTLRDMQVLDDNTIDKAYRAVRKLALAQYVRDRDSELRHRPVRRWRERRYRP